MPHIPLQFREVPDDDRKPGNLAPSDPAAAMGLPTDMPPNPTKPRVRQRPTPRSRTFRRVRAKESLSIGGWDVNPHTIIEDLQRTHIDV